VAQDQSDAKLPRPSLHQCARDHDLAAHAKPARRAIRSTTRRSRPATRTSRSAPIGRCVVHRRGNGSKAWNGKKLHPTQKPGIAARAGDSLLLTAPTISCSIHSRAPVRPAPSPSCCAAAFIGFERDASLRSRARQRIAAVEPLPTESLAPFMTRAKHRGSPFSALLERGLVSAGARLVDAKRRHAALVRADGAITLGGTVARSTASAHWHRGSSPATAGPSGMSKPPKAHLDRRTTRRDTRRDGGGLG